MMSIPKTKLVLILALYISSNLFAGTTGKLAGILHDKQTGEPLIGANIVVQGTYLGASSDLDGQYSILNIPPGTYAIEFSYIGYKKVIVNDVRIEIDQTTRLDFDVEENILETDEIVIVAKRDFIKKDVSTSVVSVTDKEMKTLPVTSIDNVVGLQAGIKNGLSIRGGSASSVLFMMDGVTLRDPRNNEPASKLALSSVEEISVVRGGFNAEYGQVRSGIVNVVSKEGSKNKYSGSFQIRYSPPALKYQKVKGTLDIHDQNSYVFRPFYDDAVAWTGTENGEWDQYTRAQYPTFIGWNEVSRQLNIDNNPDNDLTPLGAQRAFMYETRKEQPDNLADYDIDAGFGGPVPFLNDFLGDLRFFSSFRSTRDVLLFPLSRPDYKDYDWTVRLNSKISSSSSFSFSMLNGKQYTMRHNWDSPGGFYYPHWSTEIADVASYVGSPIELLGMFSDYNFSLSDVEHQSYALKYSETISANTYYEISLEQYRSEYYTRPQALRDTSESKEIITSFFEDSNPFGYWRGNTTGVILTGGSQVARVRDFSVSNSTTLKANFTSQLNFYNQLKTGFEVNYFDLNLDYGIISQGLSTESYSDRVKRRDFPIRFSAYIQNKLETEGFALNAGLRLDYSNSNSTLDGGALDTSDKNPAKAQIQLSPRLGVSHPISENAKLYFNYGHFKQIPDYETMFRIQRNSSGELNYVGDPNLTLAKTVSYELGFDYLINDEYLINIAAFYRDITNQQENTQYIPTTTGATYSKPRAIKYEDVKGFEITFKKSYGNWFNGFTNYTYQVGTSGNFGTTRIYQSPVAQKNWDDQTVNQYLDRPEPSSYARANISFFTPENFGPDLLGIYTLENWNLNLLFDWSAGSKITYRPLDEDGIKGIANNVKEVDYVNLNLRLSKTINFGAAEVQLFADMNNVTNELRLWVPPNDQEYKRSLHLPKSEVYNNIVGNDKIGDYRKPGVDYQPMKQVPSLEGVTNNDRAIFYVNSTRPVMIEVDGVEVDYNHRYLQRIDGELVEVNSSMIKKILKDKAYIDMPNASTYWFLNPRRIFYGIRLSYNF